MDAKITKERLSRMLSYDWLKIIGVALAAILFWALVFTVSATRITPAQQFTVINYFGNDSLSMDFLNDLSKAREDGLFSYEVMETTTVDVGGNGEIGATLMQTRVATEEGDVVFVPNILDTTNEYDIQGEKYQETHMETLVRGYRFNLEDLDREKADGYFGRLEAFLNRYYGDYTQANATLNKDLVKQDFLARVEKNKDKRFKKSEQIEKGILDEIARVEKYRAALIEFDGYVESGLVQFTTTQVRDLETGEIAVTGIYSINICADPSKMPSLTKLVSYSEVVEEGKPAKPSAKDMNIAIMRFDGVEDSFEFESLLYINYVLRFGQAQ